MIVLWIILGILLFIIGFVVFALCSKTRVYISYKEDKLKIRFRNGLLRYTWKQKEQTKKKKTKHKKKAPSKTRKAENSTKTEEINRESIEKEVRKKKQSLSDKTSFLWTLLGEMRYRIEVVKVKIKINYGTGDPADTGILYGVIWAAIGNLYQVFSRYLVLDFPETEIEPDFENKVFKTEFEGIIKVKILHVISALVKSINN